MHRSRGVAGRRRKGYTARLPSVGSVVGRDSPRLRPWQAKVFYAALSATLGYLHRLGERINKRRFPQDDELPAVTRRAYEGMLAEKSGSAAPRAGSAMSQRRLALGIAAARKPRHLLPRAAILSR